MGAERPDDDERVTGVHEVPHLPIAVDTVRGQRVKSATIRLVCVAGVDLGRSFSVGPVPLVFGRGAAVDAALRAGDVSRRHARVSWRDGGLVVEDLGSANGTFVEGVPVQGAAPAPVGAHVQLGGETILVISHHDELEARMRQLQHLEAMADVVGDIACGFNDALMVLSDGLDQVAGHVIAGNVELNEVMGDMREAADGAIALAKRLIEIRQRDDPGNDVVPVAAMVDETVAMVSRAVAVPPATMVRVSPDVHVRGSRQALQQALRDLCLNACDAMPQGGTLTIEADVVHLTRGEALARHLRGDSDYVELTMTDTGVGMDDAALARLFEPVVTAKHSREGASLGLALVHGVVRRHGGVIAVESSAGRGTTFRIWLPGA